MDKILAFSHLPKTGGTSVTSILRAVFGLHHVDIRARHSSKLYTKRDCTIDRLFVPRLRSMAGHALRPFVDLGDHESQLFRFTFVRDPLTRVVSHYEQMYDPNRGPRHVDMSFRPWLNVPENRNWMVKFISGTDDFAAARDIIDGKLGFVGVTERFNESLELLSRVAGVNLSKLNVHEKRSPMLTVRKEIQERIEEYEAEIYELNDQDAQLYKYVLEYEWPKQVQQLSVLRAPERLVQGQGSALNRRLAFLHRNLIYRPAVFLDEKLHTPA